MKDHEISKIVKSIKLEVTSGDKKDVKLSTQFSDEETIRILKQCLISLEKEASQNR